jgi:hypothetical protein
VAGLVESSPDWHGNWSGDCFVAFAWEGADGQRLLIAVNYPGQSQRHLYRVFEPAAS